MKVNKFKQKGYIVNPFVSDSSSLPTENPTDPLVNYSDLLIRGDEIVLADRSPMAAVLTNTGGVAFSGVRAKYGSTSLYFPSDGNLKATPPSGKSAFVYTGDFEIHMDVYFENNPVANSILVNLAGVEASMRWQFYRNPSGQILLDIYGIGTSLTTPVIPNGQWVSLVLGRSDRYCFYGINSVITSGSTNSGTKTTAGNLGSTNGAITINGGAGGAGGMYIQNLRVLGTRNFYNGIYTSKYKASTELFKYTPVDESIIDPLQHRVLLRLPLKTDLLDKSSYDCYVNSSLSNGTLQSDAQALNGIAFKGSSPNGLVARIGRMVWGNFCIEFKARFDGAMNRGYDKRVFLFGNGANYSFYLQIASNSNGGGYLYIPPISGWPAIGFTFVAGVNYTICVERIGQQFITYIDGIVKNVIVSDTYFNSSDDLYLVGNGGGAASADNWMFDDFRLTIGNRYNGYSRVPTARTSVFPYKNYVTNITDPKYALRKIIATGDGPDGHQFQIDKSLNKTAMLFFGNAKIESDIFSNNRSGFRLNGISQNDYMYLNATGSTDNKIGGKKFCIEFKAKVFARNANGGRFIACGTSAVTWNSTTGIQYLIQTDTVGLSFSWTTTGYAATALSIPMDLNTEYDIAISYDLTTVRIFKNGIIINSSLSPVIAPSSVTPQLIFGAIPGEGGVAATYAANAAMRDFRFTLEDECYNSNYTPSYDLQVNKT